MHRVNSAYLRVLLEQYGLDGLLVVEPENFAYFAGVPGFPATIWRRAGPASVIVPPDGDVIVVAPDSVVASLQMARPDVTVFSHPLWTERVDIDQVDGQSAQQAIAAATAERQLVRPETYDLGLVHQLVRQAIERAGLLGGRVGIEMEFLPKVDFDLLQALLETTELVSSSALIRELRIFKSPAEIQSHRVATQLAEDGIVGAITGLNAGPTVLDIRTRYSEVIQRVAREQGLLGFAGGGGGVNVGKALFGTRPPEMPVQPGELIQFDCGTTINHCFSDIGRTFSYGPVQAQQRDVESALLAGFQAGLERLKPGERFCDVFNAAQQAVRDAGFPSYTRGHVGHSIGSTIYYEEWPFFSAKEERVLEPGMVVAFEVPYYINGIGPFQFEDNLVITETGHESFNRLPLEIREIEIDEPIRTG